MFQRTVLLFIISTSTIIGCSKKDSPQPEETVASMKNIQNQPMSECPDLNGMYQCTTEEDSTPFNIVLRKNAPNDFHFSYIDSTSSTSDSFIGRTIEKIVSDDGGFNITGVVEDKASFAKDLSVGILDPKLIEQMRLAYVGSCQNSSLKIHYIMGPAAIKLTINKNADNSITQTLYNLDEEGNLKKETGTCTSLVKNADGTLTDPSGTPVVEKKPEAVPSIPKEQQVEIESYPSDIYVELVEKNGRTFDEPVNIHFERHGRIMGRHLYTFKKSYIGAEDNRAWFWWQQGDDVDWSSPWSMISIDMRTRRVFGGTKAGEGAAFGNILYDGKSFKLDMLIQYSIDKDAQRVSFLEKPVATSTTECLLIVQTANMCTVYVGIYDTLSSIDYSAIGESGPAIANQVVSVSTAFKLAKSSWFFKGEMDEVRKDYLIPVLHSIGQLKALKRADKNNRQAYIQQTTQVYSNMIVTTLDTILKTQKLVPDAIQNVGKTSFGFLLQHIGMGSLGGDKLAGNQPRWVGEIVTPVALKFAGIGMDIIFNTSNTSFGARVERLLEIEEDLRVAIKRLCESSPTTQQNDCQAALNQ